MGTRHTEVVQNSIKIIVLRGVSVRHRKGFGMAKSTSSIRANLNQDIVKRLTHDLKPVGVDHKGKLVFEPNVNGDIYTVLDASQDALKGFGVRAV
ncbi:MAG TPA: hypothetical protein PLJ14_09910 [Accumulibacter sp.]|nr:hypothetical protein [Accumulibacter sp.]HNH24732.1 hypothetical protein [Accumulibacter sp.]HNK00918.1 hypothetical protein [Accumulibacter sp.]